MKDKIIFFNTGWMDFYKGLSNDIIKGGGKHIENEGWGGEIYNFKNYNGRVYGYVQPKIDKKYGNASTIKIEKLGISKNKDKVSGVTVVWTARHPDSGGTYIVGWYLNATVYRYAQLPPKTIERKHKGNKLGFYATAETKDVILLSFEERNVCVKRQEKNWMGQSNVWYAESNPDFVNLVSKYILRGISPITPNPTSPKQPDPLRRIEVEKNAVKVVVKYYEKYGYIVSSVEKDNVGWDLIATKEKVKLKLEVKGLSGTSIVAELTPNELKNLKDDRRFYRLCIVTEALTTKPKLKIFAYSEETKAWTSKEGEFLNFEEIISARIYI